MSDINFDFGKSIKTDIVFTVDNSGGMRDEADAIARVAELLDGKQHRVHITIPSSDDTIVADKTFYVIFNQQS